MKRFEFPKLKLNEDTVENDVELILTQIKPHWRGFLMTPISGGFSCLLYRCSSTLDPNDVIAVRVIKRFGNSPLCDAKLEVQVLNQLERHGHFSPVLATFQNGYCYRYLNGKPLLDLTSLPLRLNDHLLRLVASRVAHVHSMSLPGNVISHVPFLVRLIRLLKERGPSDLPPGIPEATALISELGWLKAFLHGQGGGLVCCHGDLHSGNVIWDEEKDTVFFVDWEWTHIGPRASDLAFFLYTLQLTDLTFGPGSLVLPPNHEKKFLEYYQATCAKLEKRNVQEADIAVLKQQIRIFKLAAMLTVAVVQTVFQEIPSFLSDNPNEFLAKLYSDYFTYKKAMLLELGYSGNKQLLTN